MAIVGTDPVARCTPEEWNEFLGMVRNGMLFEVIEWLDAGKPSLRPERKFTSAFESAIVAPNWGVRCAGVRLCGLGVRVCGR